MPTHLTLRHQFVECVPDQLEDGVVYVSVTYATVVHRCCCGCGREVVTPLSRTGWTLSFDGESISLSPSIGNWSFPCRSHYWIRRNRVQWAEQWSRDEVETARDAGLIRNRPGGRAHQSTPPIEAEVIHSAQAPSGGVFGTLRRWLRGL
jgi:hypothetical protein